MKTHSFGTIERDFTFVDDFIERIVQAAAHIPGLIPNGVAIILSGDELCL
jgi:hypothetical protein